MPQVTRKRQVVCGLKPTAVAGTTKPASTQTRQTRVTSTQPSPAPEPTQFTSVQPVPQTRIQNQNLLWLLFGKPGQRTARTTTNSDPAPTVFTNQPKTTQPTTTVVAVAPPPANEPLYRGIYTIRRVPQAYHPGDAFNGRLAGTVPVAQVTRTQPVLPEGYVSLLSTDQQQARRGVGTPQGQAAMDLIWTQTMPRRLIDTTTGRDMTAALPQIKYPYTTVVSTRTYIPQAAPVKRRPVEDEASPLNMKKIEDVSALTGGPVPHSVELTPPSHRYVQVATFGVPANARRTVAKFGAGGFPTYTRPLTRGGKSYEIVLLGPFPSDAQLKDALTQVRRAGFSDAFFVK